jgi:long-chain acyl-CoA synthetase
MNSPLESFLHWERQIPDRNFLNQPFENGKRTWTWRQAGDESRRIAAALQHMGLVPGDRVAILSKNCAHWIMADIAIMMGGFISVPLYATITADTIRQILEHSGSKAIIVGKLDHFATQAAGIPEQVADIHVEIYGNRGTYSWEALVQEFEPLAQPVIPSSPHQLQTIMYTSGTTGNPKGVMHAVGSFAAMASLLPHIGIQQHPVVFSFLPLSHIAERIGIELATIAMGGSFSFPLSLESFPQDLQATQPTHFFAVPRLWQKFREKINEKLPEEKLNKLLKIPIINSLVKKKIRKGLGLSRATRIFTGAAPISVELLLWYKKLGIEILQAYAMTEDCIQGHFSLPGANKLGCVGRPLPGVESRISDEGEVQTKCVGLLKGYYNEPELTAEVFTADGFLKTGDLGEYDSDGFLTITGRLKDQFKTDKGKYIAPAPIEMELLANTFIDQVCVVGMGIPQPIALTILSAETTKGVERQVIEKSLVTQVAKLNTTLQSYERIEKVVILPEPWTVENGLMTPTLKVKRNLLEKQYLQRYPEWYSLPGEVVWVA